VAQLEGKRVLLLGAETDLGRVIADALHLAGASQALVSSVPDAESAFTVQRLGRRLGAIAQAIDASNEAAVRVMVRQLGKELGGIDAAISCVSNARAREFFERHARKELKRTGVGAYVDATVTADVVPAVAASGD
jgi:NAD(P)-dependent dehydrogenase (short-subunit alcohol dehydrogenase family)